MALINNCADNPVEIIKGRLEGHYQQIQGVEYVPCTTEGSASERRQAAEKYFRKVGLMLHNIETLEPREQLAICDRLLQPVGDSQARELAKRLTLQSTEPSVAA